MKDWTSPDDLQASIPPNERCGFCDGRGRARKQWWLCAGCNGTGREVDAAVRVLEGTISIGKDGKPVDLEDVPF